MKAPIGVKLLAAVTGLGCLLGVVGSGFAALLPPAELDAGSGKPVLDVGAAIGGGQAWAGFLQETDGALRLYVAHAVGGDLAPPVPADRGAPVVAAALAGNGSGDGVVVLTETVGAEEVLFARRLIGGELGPAVRVSGPGQDAALPNPGAGLLHRRAVAVGAAGTAAVCFKDDATGAVFVAVLDPAGETWTRHGPLAATDCVDLGVDGRGIVVVVGQDVNGDLVADRVVDGALVSEVVDSEGRDEGSVAVSSGGSAVVLARIMDGGQFAAAAWRTADLAQDGAWQPLGRIDVGTFDPATENPEFPRGALDARGDGLLTFRVQNPLTLEGRIYVTRLVGGALLAPVELAAVNDDALPVVDEQGRAYVAYTPPDENGEPVAPELRVLDPDAGGALPLFPARAGLELATVGSLAADGDGNLLALARDVTVGGGATGATFGDFAAPVVRPRARPARPRTGQRVRLTSGAVDTLGPLAASDIEWRFPKGAVAGARLRRGKTITVRFLHPGRLTVEVTVEDEAGNVTRKTLRMAIRPA